LPPGVGAEITNCGYSSGPAVAPASFYLPQTRRNLIEKIMVAERKFL